MLDRPFSLKCFAVFLCNSSRLFGSYFHIGRGRFLSKSYIIIIHYHFHISLDTTWTVQLIYIFFPCGSTVLSDPDRLTYSRFLELFRHMVGLLGRVISPSQGLYLHWTTQHKQTRTNIYALSGIRTHDPSNQPAKTHASDRTATVTGIWFYM
jgi:hypothetical protein